MNAGFFELPVFDPIADAIAYLLSHEAVLAPIFLLTVEEAGIPLPVPGDVIIAYTGYNIRRGQLPYWGAFVIILFTVLLGSTILYWISAKWGNFLVHKFGKFMHLDIQHISTVEEKFKRYGPWVIIFGRHIPGFRIPITVFAGMSGVKYTTFILSTFISVIFWIIFYLDLGIRLGPRVSAFLRVSVSHWFIIPVLIILIVGGFLIRKYVFKFFS